MIVFALAESGPAEIKAQHREAERMQRLHRMKDNLIVQRSTKLWVRMTNQCGMGCILRATVQQSFEPSRRPLEKQ